MFVFEQPDTAQLSVELFLGKTAAGVVTSAEKENLSYRLC